MAGKCVVCAKSCSGVCLEKRKPPATPAAGKKKPKVAVPTKKKRPAFEFAD
jgi:hypothetical protein